MIINTVDLLNSIKITNTYPYHTHSIINCKQYNTKSVINEYPLLVPHIIITLAYEIDTLAVDFKTCTLHPIMIINSTLIN